VPDEPRPPVATPRAMPLWIRALAEDLCWNEVEAARLRPQARAAFDQYIEARAGELRLVDQWGRMEREASWQRSPGARQAAEDAKRLRENAAQRSRRARDYMLGLEAHLRRKEAFSAELLSRAPAAYQATVLWEARQCLSRWWLPAAPGGPTPAAAPRPAGSPARPTGMVRPPPFWVVPGPVPVERVATLAPGGPGPGAGAWSARIAPPYPWAVGAAGL